MKLLLSLLLVLGAANSFAGSQVQDYLLTPKFGISVQKEIVYNDGSYGLEPLAGYSSQDPEYIKIAGQHSCIKQAESFFNSWLAKKETQRKLGIITQYTGGPDKNDMGYVDDAMANGHFVYTKLPNASYVNKLSLVVEQIHAPGYTHTEPFIAHDVDMDQQGNCDLSAAEASLYRQLFDLYTRVEEHREERKNAIDDLLGNTTEEESDQ